MNKSEHLEGGCICGQVKYQITDKPLFTQACHCKDCKVLTGSSYVVNTSVLEGRILLTGLVDNQEIRIDAVRLVWEVDGVKEIINEIEIGNRTTLKDYASDLWINTQARALAAKTVGIKAITFNFETIQGKIYIAGITARPDLLDEMIIALKNIKGVNEIVNYVIIREKL